MKTIWKYQLAPARPQITTPRNSQVITAAAQGDEICVWATVDTERPHDEIHRFSIFGTGHPIPDGQRIFRGTAFLGPLVFHVFERTD
jgi:hypothetical protein